MAKPRILVVEDTSIIAKDIEKTLARLGYDVSGVAYSGERAIEAAAADRPDLVLMDIVLKGAVDGIAAAEVIRERCQIPVVYLTAYSDQETLQRAKLTEPYGYVLKPFEERELHAVVEMALFKHRAEQERARLLRELEEAVAEIKTLRGIIPICASCKKVRDDAGFWKQVEVYLSERSDAQFSHGLCPDCMKKMYSDLW